MGLEKVTLTGASEYLEDGFTKVNSNVDYSLEGDGTTRVFRCMRVTIQNGTTALTIKVKTENIYNHTAITEENNLGASGDTGYFNLNSDKSQLHIESGAFAANVSHIIFANVVRNAGGNFPYVYAAVVSNGITLYFRHNDDTAYDLTTHVDTGNLYVDVHYLTVQA
jgi:hypothetical protein